jgi:hypothetical protein
VQLAKLPVVSSGKNYGRKKMTNKTYWIDPNFYKNDNHKQRMFEKDWGQILLNFNDKIMVRGHIRHLTAKKLGYGIVEVSMQPLHQGD